MRFFFNAMSVHYVDSLDRIIFFITHELPYIFGKESRVASYCLRQRLELKSFFLIDWLFKARESSLLFNFTYNLIRREENDSYFSEMRN